MPMLFSPTIGAAIAAGYWFLWVQCPACRTINAIDLRTLDRHRDAAVILLFATPLIDGFQERPTQTHFQSARFFIHEN